MALQLARRRLVSGDNSLNAAYELVEDSKDVLTQSLDSQVTIQPLCRIFTHVIVSTNRL